jgi:hypothetical protein
MMNMKMRIFTNKKHIITTFVYVVLALIISLSSGLTVNATFSGHSSALTREQLQTQTRAMTVNMDAPAITFLTHGLGGTAGHWSNSMYRTEDNAWEGSPTFSYDSASIVEKMRNQIPTGIKLYVAKMTNQAKPFVFSTNNFYSYKILVKRFLLTF